MRKWTVSLVALGLFVAGVATPAFAQNQPDPNGQNNNGGRRGNRGGGDPAQFRQQMTDRLKAQLGATDEEWTALQPKLQKVLDAQRDSRGGGFGGRGGGRRGGADAAANTQPAAADPAQSEVAKASAELRTALENKDTPAGDIAVKLKALRDAKEKAKGGLASAQKELKELLTQRQEAVLVTNGVLD